MQIARFPRHAGAGPEASLEYCFDAPRQWTFIHKPLRVQFRGWAASFADGEPRVTVTDPAGATAEYGMTIPRPDVVSHFANQGKDISLLCGFDFVVDIPQQRGAPYTLALEVHNDGFSSGPVNFVANDFGSMQWPPLEDGARDDVPRGNYKETWNAVSGNVNDAKVSVAGYTAEDEFERTSRFTLQVLQHTVGVYASDVILEIGCGVGRMARTLAPLCRRWIGTRDSAPATSKTSSFWR